MQIKKLLEKCLETFGPNGERWAQGTFKKNVRGVEKFCSLGAIRYVVCDGVTSEDRQATEVLVSKVFAELFNAKAGSDNIKYGDVVVIKNDNSATKFDEIKLAFERALALADLAENLVEKTKLERDAAMKARDELQKVINEQYNATVEEVELQTKLNNLRSARARAEMKAREELEKTEHLLDSRSTYLGMAEKAAKIRPIEQKK